MGVLRGPAHRERAARASTTCGRGLFKDLYPRFHTMRGQLRRPQGRLGLPRPAGRGRGREGARLLGQARDRGLRHRRVQPAVPRVGAALRRGLVGRSRAASACGSTPRTRTGRSTNEYIESVWWLFQPDVGRAATSTRATRSSRTAAGAAPRSRATSSASPARTTTSPSRRCTCASPCVDRDFDLLVWTTTPWTLVSNVARRRRARTSSTSACARRDGGARPRARARRVSPTVLGDDAEVVGTVAVADLVGLHYERPFDAPRRSTRRPTARVVADDFVTVDDGSRHRAPRARVRRDRPRGRASARASRSLNPVDAAARFDASSTRRTAGKFVKDADPALDRRARRVGTPRTGSSTTRTRTRTAGAAARRSSTGPSPRGSRARPRTRTRCSARTRRSAGTPSTSSTAASATGSRTTSTGRSRATASGAHRSRSGAATTAGTTRASARSPSWPSSPAATSPDLDLHRPYVDDVVDRRARSAARHATHAAVEPVLDAWFDSGSMPAAQFHYPFENDDAVRAALPRRLHLRGDRPDARLVLLAARGEHARVRPRAVPQRRVPRAHRRPGRPEDVEVARATSSTRGRSSRRAAPTRCAGTSSRRAHRGRRSACRSTASTSRRASSSLTLWNTYSFFVTYANLDGWDAGDPARPHRAPTSSTGGSARACTRTVARSPTRSRRFDALRGAQALEALRRRPLELVRPPLPAAVLEVVRPRARTRRCTSACSTVTQLLAPFCPFVADELLRATSRGTRRVGAPRRLARGRRRGASTRSSRPRWRGARSVVSLGLVGAHRGQAQGAPAAAPRARARARRRAVLRPTPHARSPTSST